MAFFNVGAGHEPKLKRVAGSKIVWDSVGILLKRDASGAMG